MRKLNFEVRTPCSISLNSTYEILNTKNLCKNIFDFIKHIVIVCDYENFDRERKRNLRNRNKMKCDVSGEFIFVEKNVNFCCIFTISVHL